MFFQALGNHEFDKPLSYLQEFIRAASPNIDIVSCNIDNSQEPGLTGYKPYIIKRMGTRKVGIVGYTTPKTLNTTAVGKEPDNLEPKTQS